MIIIGVDYHPSFQEIAWLDQETGEYGEDRLNHGDGQADRFYRDLKQYAVRVRVGTEATGCSRWFERLTAELDFELWIGDPAEIKAARVRKKKTVLACAGGESNRKTIVPQQPQQESSILAIVRTCRTPFCIQCRLIW